VAVATPEETNVKNPPIFIAILGFFAVVAGLSWFVWGLRLLGFDWFNFLGDMPKFEQAGLWGWVSLGLGAFWFALGVGLWALESWARVSAMVLAGINLIVAFTWFLMYPGSGLGMWLSIMPVVILLYLNGESVRRDFGQKVSY
jgi:hypothetical protein